MTTDGSEKTIPGSTRFDALLQDGYRRVKALIPRRPFSFDIQGEIIDTTVDVVVLLSPKIAQFISNNPDYSQYRFENPIIKANDVRHFADFIDNLGGIPLLADDKLSVLALCTELENDLLTFLVLGSLRSDVTGARISTTDKDTNLLFTDPYENRPIDMTLEYAASKFYSYQIDEIKQLSQITLHKILTSPALELESEDKFVRTLRELGRDYIEFWKYVDFSCVSEDNINELETCDLFPYFSGEVWCNLLRRLRKMDDSNPHPHRFCIKLESQILGCLPSILKDLNIASMDRLFSGHAHNFNMTKFHGCCSGNAMTLTIIETTKGWIFGSFTSAQWPVHGKYGEDQNWTSFLFSLKNPWKMPPKKFPIKNRGCAIYADISRGPIFGDHNRPDISISDHCNTNVNSYTNIGGAYLNDTGIPGEQIFTGEITFVVKHIEVFKITLFQSKK
jgi:hypothetical protein